MEHTPWIWLVAAVVLLTLEVLTGTLALLFFGLAASASALFAALWGPSLTLELLIFGALGVAGSFALRPPLARWLARKSHGSDVDHPDLNQRATARESIAPRAEGTVDYQGSPWIAVNVSDHEILSGAIVEIAAVDGIKLKVKGKKA